MFLLVWLLFIANSEGGAIKLKEAMIVHTNDGDKYLYHPSESDMKYQEEDNKQSISSFKEESESISEAEKNQNQEEESASISEAEKNESQEDICTWLEWGKFTKCESIGELNASFMVSYSYLCIGRQ